MPIDVQRVLEDCNIVEVVGRYLKLEKSGTEYEACCPFHNETTPSFKVSESKQFYHCFGCGAHGDAIKFVQEYSGVGFKDAVAELVGENPPRTSGPAQPRKQLSEKEEAKEWQPVMPVPDGVPAAPKTHSKKVGGKWTPLEWAGAFAYRDQSGALLGYVARFEYETDGKRKKEYTPQTWCRNANTGELEWRKVSFPKPRPLYNLDKLAANPNAIVILCEGEKKADAVMRMLPYVVGVSWSGGGKAIKHTAWQPLQGRRVLGWRDADQPGIEAMDGKIDPRTGEVTEGVAHILKDVAAAFKVLDPPHDVPESWDAWDAEQEGWTRQQVEQLINSNSREPALLRQPEEHPASEPDDYSEPPMPTELPDDDGDSEPYRALGYDHGHFFYLAGAAAQVIDLSASAHTKLNLLSIAPLAYWNRKFPPARDSDGAMWDMAANAMMSQCHRAGVYNPELVRGRGAWWDNGRALLHIGNELIIDGAHVPLMSADVLNIYEAAPPLHIDTEDALSSAEAKKFADLCGMLQWERPIAGRLLAGGIFIATICGALEWRPHLWITGPSGSGKSWVQSNIVTPVLSNISLTAKSNTSEAGIRQQLGMDSRPVIFDEFEGETIEAQQNIQRVMGLARQASSEDGGAIIKGSASGKAMSFRIRSMFIFSSIGVGVQQYADKTRVTVLPLQVITDMPQAEKDAKFQAIQKFASEFMTPEYCARLRARAVNMIGVIRENAKTFARAGAAVIGTQRLGDQIGALIAGVHALHSSRIVTLDEAREWLERQDWSEENALHEVKDEQACVSHLLQHVVRVTGDQYTQEKSIGELINIALTKQREGDIGPDSADEQLLRLGIKVQDGGFVVSNTHTALGKILTGTLWAKQWSRILKRIDGAKALDPLRFGSGGTSRGVWIPGRAVTGK